MNNFTFKIVNINIFLQIIILYILISVMKAGHIHSPKAALEYFARPNDVFIRNGIEILSTGHYQSNYEPSLGSINEELFSVADPNFKLGAVPYVPGDYKGFEDGVTLKSNSQTLTAPTKGTVSIFVAEPLFH